MSGSSSVVSVVQPVGLLVSGSAVAAAPLFLPEEARHVPACVAGHDAGPSWCWVQAVVSDLSAVMSHKGDSVAVM